MHGVTDPDCWQWRLFKQLIHPAFARPLDRSAHAAALEAAKPKRCVMRECIFRFVEDENRILRALQQSMATS